jgi:hypothetical protein
MQRALLVLLAACLAVTSCAAERGSDRAAPMAEAGAAGDLDYATQERSQALADGGTAAPPAAAPARRKLVKTVDLELRVRDTEATAAGLRDLAERQGGYLAAMNASRRNDLLHYTLTLRVPVERLEQTVALVKEGAERVEREAIRTEDVTDRFVDLEARLRTLRATEDELRQLLAESRERARKVDEIMAVYQQLTTIRSQIEQIQGQLQSLGALAALSTVNVELVPTEAARPLVAEGWQPADTVRGALRTLVSALQGLADFAIVLLIVGAPLLAAIALPVWLVVVLLRRWARRRRTALPDESGTEGPPAEPPAVP